MNQKSHCSDTIAATTGKEPNSAGYPTAIYMYVCVEKTHESPLSSYKKMIYIGGTSHGSVLNMELYFKLAHDLLPYYNIIYM